MGIKVFQLHKKESILYKNIQDKFSFDIVNQTLSVADGTTQSFNSGMWAELLTESFKKNPTFDKNEIISLFTKQVDIFNESPFEYSTKSATLFLQKELRNKGGTSTFLGVQLKENTLQIISCGDSNLIHISDGSINFYPFNSVEDLDANQSFINSVALKNGDIDKSYFKTETVTVNENDIIILGTDAISRFMLKNKGSIKDFININNFDDFINFIEEKWNSQKLEIDDITALIYKINKNDSLKKILPPENFKFDSMQPTDIKDNNDYQFLKDEVKSLKLDINNLKTENEILERKLSNYSSKMKITTILFSLFLLTSLINLGYSMFKFNQTSEIKEETFENRNILDKPKSSDSNLIKIDTIEVSNNIDTTSIN